MGAEEQDAHIYISRDRDIGSYPFVVLVDRRNVGSVAPGQRDFDIRVSPGEHVLQIANADPTSVTAKPGGVVRVKVQRVLFGRPLVFVTPDFGAFLGSGGVYATRNTPLPSLLALRNQPSGAVASPFQRTGPIESFQIVEASRREIPLGEERRVIDNSQSSSMTSHTIRLTKEWTRSYTLDLTTATSGQVSGGFAAGFVALKAAAERAVSSRYSASIQERQSFEEEVTVSSAAHTHSEIFFSWKQVRQRGKVVVRSQGGSVEIPFEVVIGVTFDQRQVDVPATRRRT